MPPPLAVVHSVHYFFSSHCAFQSLRQKAEKALQTVRKDEATAREQREAKQVELERLIAERQAAKEREETARREAEEKKRRDAEEAAAKFKSLQLQWAEKR